MSAAADSLTPHPPRKICFVSLQARGAFVPGAGVKIGGAERQVRLLAGALAAIDGFDVHAIVEDSGQPEREVVDGVTLWRLDQPAERPSRAGRAWRKLASGLALRNLAQRLRADVYLQRCAGAETGLVQHAARSAGGRFVFMMANDWELEPPWSAGNGLAGRLFRRGLRRADLVVCQHEAQQAGIRRLFGRESAILPNAYAFRPVVPEAGDRILWIGRCVRQKRPERFLELARRLPGRPFLMIAQPTTEERPLFETTGREAAALPNLEWIPGLPPDRLDAVYRRSGLLVNTSDREGMPNTFLEAADAGLGLVSLSVDPGGMFSRQGTGIVAGGVMDRLIETVDRLAADSAERRALAARGRAWLAEHHDLPRVAAGLRQLLDRLRA